MPSPEITENEALVGAALDIRKKLVKMHYKARSAHIGTGLSTVELLTYIYGKLWSKDLEFILSKGHGASALYATLNRFKLLSDSDLDTYYTDGTHFPGHPAPLGHPLIPLATGSLGHGLSVASGVAFTNMYLKPTKKSIVTLLSDGECNEGSVWEAALFASHHHLSNLTVVVDVNGLQGFGKTKDVLNLEPFAKKFEAFGFITSEIDGHSFEEIDKSFKIEHDGRPRCILAKTVKGKGIPFMENTLDWHYLTLNETQYLEALSHLEGKKS